MGIGISILGGGSRGNALLVHTPSCGILVDAGFSRKEILRRLDRLKIDAGIIKAILVTHEHGDHIDGCRVLSEHLKAPVYVSARTYEYVVRTRRDQWSQVQVFAPGTSFCCSDFQVAPFAVQHDAVEPVGFVINHDCYRIGIATDLGCINELVKQRLRDCTALVLESNYDQDMLRDSDRAIALKRRIMGRHGHLDNREAVAALPELLTQNTKALFFTHISSDCNRHDLVEKIATSKLHELGRQDIIFNVVLQDEPTATVWL